MSGASPLVTQRGIVAVAGEDVALLIDRAIRGELTYERNFFRLIADRVLDAEELRAANAVLLGLAVCQSPDVDFDLTRLCASVGASLEESLRPPLALYGALARVATFLQAVGRGEAPGAAPAGVFVAPDGIDAPVVDAVRAALTEEAVGARMGTALGRLETMAAQRGLAVSMDAMAAAALLGLGVPAALAPFVKIVARMPVLARAWRAERACRPNRFVGLARGRAAASPDAAHPRARALSYLRAGGTYVDLFADLMLDRALDERERRVTHAALIAGAQYGGTAASSSVTRLMATEGTTVADTYQAVMSTFGFFHLGALKECARFLERAVDLGDELEAFVDEQLRKEPAGLPAARGRVAGFGHRFQSRDPRAAKLLRVCDALLRGRYTAIAARLDGLLYERRVGHINMDGIGAAMALQVGFTAETTPLVSLIARTPGIARDYLEASAAGEGPFHLKAREARS